jgi:hypothetical protein
MFISSETRHDRDAIRYSDYLTTLSMRLVAQSQAPCNMFPPGRDGLWLGAGIVVSGPWGKGNDQQENWKGGVRHRLQCLTY